MADEAKKPDDSTMTDAPPPEAAADARTGEATEAPPEQDRTAVLEAELEKLEGQIGDLTDRLLRAHADLDNLRRRTEREKEETARYAITKFARDVAGVADNFERAVQAVPAGAAEQDPALKSLIDGVSMTEREFQNVLERHGVRRVNPKGDLFNPHLHQAMMEIQNSEVPNGTIMEVYQAGYVIDERVLRPAMVVVAKGGQKQPKPGAEPPAAEQGGSDAGATTASPPDTDAA